MDFVAQSSSLSAKADTGRFAHSVEIYSHALFPTLFFPRSFSHALFPTSPKKFSLLAPAMGAVDERQHLGDGLKKIGGDFAAYLDGRVEGAGERLVFY